MSMCFALELDPYFLILSSNLYCQLDGVGIWMNTNRCLLSFFEANMLPDDSLTMQHIWILLTSVLWIVDAC